MKPADRARLTAALREHVAAIAADLRTKIREPGPARERAVQLHKDEEVGDDFDVWTDLLSRRAAVLWVLKSVYVRVLEDRGFSRVREEELLDLAREHGAIEEARLQAERYAESARRALRGFDPSPYRDALEALPDFILARDH